MTKDNLEKEKKPESKDDIRILTDFENIMNNRGLRNLDSNNPNNMLKMLSNPRFLGSYHLKNDTNPKFKPIDNLIKGERDLKQLKSLRNTVFNPITLILVALALGYNIFLLFLLLF